LVRPVVHKEFHGIRVTPNLYTTEEELARFVEILRAARTGGLS
jgi:selenocysteine lyase/cysteine desulfurase